MATKTDSAIPTEAEAKAFLAKGKAEVKAQRKAAAKAKKPAKAKKAAKAERPEPAPKVKITAKGLKPVEMRKGSKQAAQFAALLTAKGATRDELCKLTGFTPGTQMSALHGSRMDGLLKKLGGKLTSTPDEKRGTVYRIVKK